MYNMKSLRNPWHLNEFPNNLLKGGYIEWKYFNFSAPGVSGIILYIVDDPLNLTGIGGGRLVARIFTDKKTYGGAENVPMKNVAVSDKNAGIVMGKNNFIRVIGENYEIAGKLGDISWRLKYSPLLQPVLGFANMKMDFLGVEKASWEIKMPRARVSGVVKIGKRAVHVRSFGYADANWGNVAIPSSSQFKWAQYNDRKVSVVFGEIHSLLGIAGKRGGHWAEIFLLLGGKRIAFREREIGVLHSNWTITPGTKAKVPRATVIHAENKNYDLNIEFRAIRSDHLELKTPFSLPIKPIVMEQPSFITGELCGKKAGSLRLLHRFSGRGFMEYAFCAPVMDVGIIMLTQSVLVSPAGCFGELCAPTPSLSVVSPLVTNSLLAAR